MHINIDMWLKLQPVLQLQEINQDFQTNQIQEFDIAIAYVYVFFIRFI